MSLIGDFIAYQSNADFLDSFFYDCNFSYNSYSDNDAYSDDSYEYYGHSSNIKNHNTNSVLKRLHENNHFSDITIKVGSKTHQLHRVILTLKSNYFETLFTGKFVENDCKELEISLINEEQFSSIVDYIYNEDLESVLNKDNFVSLLMAMDYLQMEINLEIFEKFIHRNILLEHEDISDDRMFELHDFLRFHPDYEYLLAVVRQFFSKHLTKISDSENFLALKITELKEILTFKQVDENNDEEKHHIANICSKWICKDLDNRLQHIVELVNAAKYRYNEVFEIADRKHEELFHDDPMKRCEEVEQYFQKLFTYHGEINLDTSISKNFQGSNNEKDKIVNKINKVNKIKNILRNEYFHDVLIKAEKNIFRLHRIILSMKSDYFFKLFIKEGKLTSKTNEITQIQLPNEIDDSTFHAVVQYLYYEKINLTPNHNFINLLRASKILKANDIFDECEKYIKENVKTIKNNIFELLTFTNEKHFTYLHETIVKHILSYWPKIYDMPNFSDISVHQMRQILAIPTLQLSDENDILKVCTKWISHDAENRYCYVAELANVINRNSTMKCKDYRITCEAINPTEKDIEQKLHDILNSTKIVSLSGDTFCLDDEKKPFFLVSQDRKITFLNANIETIAGICPLQSIRRLPSAYGYREQWSKHASTLRNENLFISFRRDNQHFFNFYNFTTQKYTSLAPPGNLFEKVTLLNYKDDIYYCGMRDGIILKYSPKLNRWLSYLNSKSGNYSCYTSDSKVLYQFYCGEYNEKRYSAQFYDDRQSTWITLPDFIPAPAHRYDVPISASIINTNLCILFSTHTIMLNQRSGKWTTIADISERNFGAYVENFDPCYSKFTAFKQNKNEILYVTDRNIVYSYSPMSNRWLVKKNNSSNVNTDQKITIRDIVDVHFVE